MFLQSEFSTLDALNDAMQAVATANRGKGGDEQARRQIAMRAIDEILEGRELSAFSADQLELLELLLAYWRELEVTTNAPGPDAT